MRFTLDGSRILLRASDGEIDLLSGMLGQLTELVDRRRDDPRLGEGLPGDPALARLLPDPVHGDAAAAAELRRLTESALLTHKRRNAATVEALLGDARDSPAPLGAAAELAMLQSLTDLRLVLAARLGIERDGDRGRRGSRDERRMQAAYHWLGAVQSELLDTIERREG